MKQIGGWSIFVYVFYLFQVINPDVLLDAHILILHSVSKTSIVALWGSEM